MIDVHNAVATVYALCEVDHRISVIDDEVVKWHRHDALKACRCEIKATLDNESRLLARAFHDYIVTVCAGEARHARDHCPTYWSNFPVGGNRGVAWRQAQEYDPLSLLRALCVLYEQTWGDSSYGGAAWCRIAEAGMMYYTTSPLLFIDHAVDLAHNGGLFLDKGVIFDLANMDGYLRMLNTKAEGSLLEHKALVHRSCYRQVVDALRVAGLPTTTVRSVPNPDWGVEALEWGTRTFNPATVENYSYEDHDYEEEEDENDVEKEQYYAEPAARPV